VARGGVREFCGSGSDSSDFIRCQYFHLSLGKLNSSFKKNAREERENQRIEKKKKI